VIEDENPARILGRSEVFQTLSEERRRRLALAGIPVDLAPGKQLFARGDPGDACYVVLAGSLEVTASDAEGREVWLAALMARALIGEMAMLDGRPRSATVTATRRTRLLRIGRDSVREALLEEPQALLALTTLLARRLRSADALIEENALVGLAGRLARLLLQEGTGPVTLSQSEMARLIGASRERVNRTLSDWKARGLIDIGRSGLRVTDHARLAALVRSGDMI